ncbi:hypothetical protein BGZ57DRAFT_851978 [Hyaloscypha finlandica]|nr:hypothetical protein BGZ57DRAFT_851978 [Hyaloscypha finlandica]
MGGRRPGSLSSLCSCAWLWCTGGCSPEHSNHNKLGGNSGLLRSLRACDQKVAPRCLRESEGLRESERENPWGLTGFVLLLHFFMQESPCVELSLFGPVGKLAGCLRHEQQVIDLVPPVATHPFFHFHMFWCSSEAIRAASDPALFPFPPSASELAAANHWVLVLQTTALESLCATTVPDSSTRLKNTAQGSLSSLSSLCIRRWLAVCSSSRPRRMQVSRTHRNRFMQAEV